MDRNEFEELEGLEGDDSSGAPPEEGTDIPWGWILLGVWAVALVVFSVQNAGETTVRFLAWEWSMPLAVLVMFTALATLVLTIIGKAYRQRRLKRLQQNS